MRYFNLLYLGNDESFIRTAGKYLARYFPKSFFFETHEHGQARQILRRIHISLVVAGKDFDPAFIKKLGKERPEIKFLVPVNSNYNHKGLFTYHGDSGMKETLKEILKTARKTKFEIQPVPISSPQTTSLSFEDYSSLANS